MLVFCSVFSLLRFPRAVDQLLGGVERLLECRGRSGIGSCCSRRAQSSRTGVFGGGSRLAVFPHTHRIVLLKLSVWAAREKKREIQPFARSPWVARLCRGDISSGREDDEAGRVYISAEASAGETKCRDTRALHLLAWGVEWLGDGCLIGVNAGLSVWSVLEQSAVAHTTILCMQWPSPLCPPLQGLRQ